MKKIVIGAINATKAAVGLGDAEIEAMAEKRLNVCKTCVYKTGVLCGKCGCVLALAARSPKKKCPIDKW